MSKMRALMALALLVAATAAAQTYPSKTIRIVVPWPAGQATDLVVREVAEQLSRSLGQAVVIDNRAGAGGRIGTDLVAKAAPDGYTLLGGSSGPVTVGPLLQKVPYDVDRQLVAVHCLSLSALVLVTHPTFSANSAAELIAEVKRQPGALTFASSGIGSMSHLVGEYFLSMDNLQVSHVPYKGSMPALNDVIGGQITYAFDTVSATLPFVRAGKLKALGVSTRARVPAMPQVPTLAEQLGPTQWDMGTWTALMAPAGTPRAILERLSRETEAVLKRPDTQERLSSLGVSGFSKPAPECAAYLKSEQQRYAALIRAKGIRLEE